MKRIHLFVDSYDYVMNEPFQHQQHKAFQRHFECLYHALPFSEQIDFRDNDILFCALRMRNADKYSHVLRNVVGDRPIYVQDHDPWCGFDDDSIHKGYYSRVGAVLNATFFVPYRFWADQIRSLGLKAVSSPIGVIPEYCDATPWEQRTIDLEFRGSLYPVRERATKRLLGAGFPACQVFEPIRPYSSWLNHLSTVRVWAHNEDEPILIDGRPFCRNWIWPKAIEVLSRGCFLIRDYHEASEEYVKDVPTAFLYHDVNDAVKMLHQIQAMSLEEKNERIQTAVNMVRGAVYYDVVCRKLEQGVW